MVIAKQLSSLEKKALDLIRKSEGILQSDLWKTLGLDSREGSRLVLRLLKKGLIRREQVMIRGRRTYKLYIVKPRQSTGKLLIDVSTLLEIPCSTCRWFNNCGPNNFQDPRTCRILDTWLRDKALENAGEDMS